MSSVCLQFAEPGTRIISKRDRAVFPAESADVCLNRRLAWIQDAPIFYGLSLADCTAIASVARERCLSRQEVIFCEGDQVSGIVFLASGRVKVTQLSDTGEQVLIRVVESGDVVGELGFPPESRCSSSAQTLDSCRVLTWGVRVFERFYERMPTLARNSLRILTDRQRVIEERFLHLVTAPAAQRLAWALIRLLEQRGCSIHKPARIEGLLRVELGQMIGANMCTVSRLLCRWEKLGLLETRRKAVVVKDPLRLIVFAEAIRTNNHRDNFPGQRPASKPSRGTPARTGNH